MPVAESLGLAALGWVLSPVVKDLVSKGTSYLGTDLEEGLEDLETTLLPRLDLMIRAAENSSNRDKFVKWLDRLKNAYYDAEAILHNLEYEDLKRNVKNQNKKPLVNKNISSLSVVQSLAKLWDKVSMLSSEKRELWDKLNMLNKIAAQAKNFPELLGVPTSLNSRPTTSPNRIYKVFGLDSHRDDIISFLLDDQGDSTSSARCYSVVAITGVGGAGKTTLAQYVYNDEKVKLHFGSRMMWLTCSQDKTIEKRIQEMIECLTEECPNLSNLHVLQNKLGNALPKSQGVLVVLDDIWYDEKEGEKQWEDLLAPFVLGGGRCKIVITSRSTSLPGALHPGKFVKLGDMAPDDFKSLFRYYATNDLETSDPQLKKDLCDIGDAIADKLSKSPLAAKTIGIQLKKRPDKTFWKYTLQNINLSSTKEVFLWSYQCMDVQLQRCFLFCGVFPRTSLHTGNDLVQYWVALDLIQCPCNNKTVEDIGFEFFQIMVANSIFELVDGKYYMHDLFRDLVEDLSARDCFRITNFEREVPPTTIYLYLAVNIETLKENKSSMGNLRNLRSLIVNVPFTTVEDWHELFSMIATNFKNLRVLDIWSRGYKTLPTVVGSLRNLRYLNIWNSEHCLIEEFPNSVMQLYHLQFLILPITIERLPTKLSDLLNLRLICKFDNKFNVVTSLPPVSYLGKLTSLQHLCEFHVGKDKGYELSQLGSLKKISGSLKFLHLHNVKHKDEAIKAKLVEKINLKRLELVWDESADRIVSDLEVIEALQPPPNLEELLINGYRNSRYPTWLGEGRSDVLNLEFLDFSNCESLTNLPPTLSKSRNCRLLILRNIGALREVGNLPECLRALHINKCPCLFLVSKNELQINDKPSTMEEKTWRPRMMQLNEFLSRFNHMYEEVLHSGEVKIFKQTVSSETCSEQLRIFKDSSLDEKQKHWENLMRAWWNCHQQRMNFIFTRSRANNLKLPTNLCKLNLSYCSISDGALSDCLSGREALEELYLEGIMTITKLPPELVMQSMRSLRFLTIRHCWCLRSLGALHVLGKLEKFDVRFCWGLEMECDYTRLPPSIQMFTMWHCVAPHGILMGYLPCLKYIRIFNCEFSRGTISFGQLTSLNALDLMECPNLYSIEASKSRPSIERLWLSGLPRLDMESISKSWKGCQRLEISSSGLLHKLLSADEFAPPQSLLILWNSDDDIRFEKSNSLQFIKRLRFHFCKTKNLPKTLHGFSALEWIDFRFCPNIVELPELPYSVQCIEIRGCRVLQEKCQPNGPEWHKIQHIPHRRIDSS